MPLGIARVPYLRKQNARIVGTGNQIDGGRMRQGGLVQAPHRKQRATCEGGLCETCSHGAGIRRGVKIPRNGVKRSVTPPSPPRRLETTVLQTLERLAIGRDGGLAVYRNMAIGIIFAVVPAKICIIFPVFRYASPSSSERSPSVFPSALHPFSSLSAAEESRPPILLRASVPPFSPR